MMDNRNKDNQNDLSSAELTANYRCVFPELSDDKISRLLSSDAGRALAEAFIEKYNYPLVQRKISVCAGYFLKEATRLIHTGYYDSIISFASGFSLLTYLIVEKNPQFSGTIFDTDIAAMIDERHKRIESIAKNHLDLTLLSRLQTRAFDIEQAYKDNLGLAEMFPDCKRPIFILDGVSYFLSSDCVDWLIKQMSSYAHSAVTLYYWPEDMLNKSRLFARVFKDLNQGMIKEELKSFWDENTLKHFKKYFSTVNDLSLAAAEMNRVSDPSLCQLIDANTYFPVRLVTGEK